MFWDMGDEEMKVDGCFVGFVVVVMGVSSGIGLELVKVFVVEGV